MKIQNILMGMLVAATWVGCGKEDNLVPTPDTLTDCFAPAPDATDEESELRRQFFKEESSYLLFNDTLRHVAVSVAPNGKTNYETELLDIDYTIGNDKDVTRKVYHYTYLTTMAEKRAAVDLLRKNIIGRLPKKMLPFSWLIVSSMESGGIDYTAVNGQRATALAVGDILSLNTDQKRALSDKILAATLSGAMSESSLEAFYAISGRDYEGYIRNPNKDLIPFYEKGFLVWGMWRGEPDDSTGPTKAADVESFIGLLFSKSLSEIETEYADYPLVVEKAVLMRNILVEIGLKF